MEEIIKDYLSKHESDLEKYVISEYSRNYHGAFDDMIKDFCTRTPSDTSLDNRPDLDILARDLAYYNRSLVENALNKYFCTIENGFLKNSLTGSSRPLRSDSPLLNIYNDRYNLFKPHTRRSLIIGKPSEFMTKLNDNIASKYASPSYFYNLEYFTTYSEELKEIEDSTDSEEIDRYLSDYMASLNGRVR